MENDMEASQKLKLELPYDSTIRLQDVYQGNDIIMLKRNSQFRVHFTALFARAKTWEQCKCSSADEQVSW